MADLPIRTGISSDDYIVWTNTGDNLEWDRYLTPVSELAQAIQAVAPAGGVVTQITSSATGVTLNKMTGQITTVALTTAATAEEEFTVTNSFVDSNDVVVVSTTYAGAGTPILSVKGAANGSFKVVVTNVHAANALNAVLVVNFVVIKGAIA